MVVLAGTRMRRVVMAIVVALVAAAGATLLFAGNAHAARQPAQGVLSLAVPSLGVPAPGAPSQGAPASYVYLRGADTLGTETLAVTDTATFGVLTMRGQPRIEWMQHRRGALLGGVTLRAFAPGAAADAPPLQLAFIVVEGDSVIATLTGNGVTRTQRIATTAGALPMINASVLHSVLLASFAQRQKLASFNVVLTSGARTIPGTVTGTGDTLVLGLPGSEARALFGTDGLPSEVSTSQSIRVVRMAGTVSSGAAVAMGTFNYDAPADAPYTAEQVRIPSGGGSGRGYELAATLTRPKGMTRAPVVITISGSGPQERDSRIALVPNYAFFRQVADTLGRRGVAVLRYDDRAVGASGGMDGASKATTADAANDVRAIVAWLRTRPDIDGSRIVLAGHSEGGIIAPMVASTDPAIKAIALIAGTAYDGRRVLNFQIGAQIPVARDAPAATRDTVARRVTAVIDSIAASSPWMQYFVAYDPLPTLRLVKQPVLVLQGETDRQVTPEQADSLAATLRAAGNGRVVVRKFPETNHLMLADPSGAPSGYSALTVHTVRPAVLGALAEWVVTVMR